MRNVFFTSAYNAEKTLHRAIDSVLNQTNPDLIYYICDNGSTDETRSIILNYADKDKRVIPILYDINHAINNTIHPCFDFLVNGCFERCDDTDYLAILDADDEYELTFLEEMLVFLTKNKLDVASSCSNHIDAKTGRNKNKVILSKNIIVSENEFGEKFSEYFRYMGAVWGKLFKCSVLRAIDRDKCAVHIKNAQYSTDTLLIFEILKSASRIGVLAKTLHKYLISENTVSFKYADKRYATNRFMHEVYRDFLIEKAGNVSAANEIYICGIYLRAIRNTTETILSKDYEIEHKLSLIHAALNHDMTLKIWEVAPDADKTGLREFIFDWIDSQGADILSNKVELIRNYFL